MSDALAYPASSAWEKYHHTRSQHAGSSISSGRPWPQEKGLFRQRCPNELVNLAEKVQGCSPQREKEEPFPTTPQERLRWRVIDGQASRDSRKSMEYEWGTSATCCFNRQPSIAVCALLIRRV
ncbi:hypothetical protein NQ318_003497 [Aromia moschata]|uniref:Uncharacterized protein n=1 Tax=Aromia moschata TaxID=1265417 RepID=A0AAV8YV81_9CUCU|nr:hypothetical protein NQ318_003497 [Aromia moschata]